MIDYAKLKADVEAARRLYTSRCRGQHTSEEENLLIEAAAGAVGEAIRTVIHDVGFDNRQGALLMQRVAWAEGSQAQIVLDHLVHLGDPEDEMVNVLLFEADLFLEDAAEKENGENGRG